MGSRGLAVFPLPEGTVCTEAWGGEGCAHVAEGFMGKGYKRQPQGKAGATVRNLNFNLWAVGSP